MTTGTTIFGLRFGSNADLNPTQEELERFLEQAKQAGSPEREGDDLAMYGTMLKALNTHERREPDASPEGFREKMFYGVLSHSRFFNPGLKLAVEQYKYHRHAHALLDFRKPSAFVKSAEEEMARLSPKKKDEAARLDRLRALTEERKRALDSMEKRRAALTNELRLVIFYIKDNLRELARLCEGAIVMLVDLQVSEREEKRLVEDIKEQFKEQLRDALHAGQVSREDLATVKRDVEALSKEVAGLLRDDIYAMTGLFEGIHDHVQKTVAAIDGSLARAEGEEGAGLDGERRFFAEVDEELTTLVKNYHFELKTTVPKSETGHGHILVEKRREILGRLFEVLKKERRTLLDRRTGEERRETDASFVSDIEQRSGIDRRTGRDRRR